MIMLLMQNLKKKTIKNNFIVPKEEKEFKKIKNIKLVQKETSNPFWIAG